MNTMLHRSTMTKVHGGLSHSAKKPAAPGKPVVAHIPQGKALWAMMAMMLSSNLLASFSQSMMNIALDSVASQFHVSLSMANWMVLGFTIVAGTMITMAGSLLKRFGVRTMMFAGYGLCLAGSVLGFFSWDFASMLAARLIQALTVGLFFPIVTSVILTIAPKGRSGTFLAINSCVIGIGLAFAPLVSGLLITYVGLKSLFAVTIVFSAILLLLGIRHLHDVYDRQDKGIDAISVALSFLGLGTFMFGLNEITRYTLFALPFMGGGIVLMGLFALRQFRIPDSLLNLKPMKHPRFVIGETLMMLGYMCSMFMSLILPLYLEGALGKTAFFAGLVLVVPILCYALACFVGGRIYDKSGIWPLIPIGFAMLIAGFCVMDLISRQELIWLMMACAAVSYIGVGLVFPSLKTTDLSILPNDMIAFGSSIHSTLVQIAGSVSSALFVGIFSARSDTLIADGTSKASAYTTSFETTTLIGIVILAIALACSVIFAWKMHKRASLEGEGR